MSILSQKLKIPKPTGNEYPNRDNFIAMIEAIDQNAHSVEQADQMRDELDTRIDNIVSNVGNSNSEIVDARLDWNDVVHPTLKDRIDFIEAKNNGLFINIKYPPPPLLGAKCDGVTDDSAIINQAKLVAETYGLPLIFPPGTYKIDSNLEFDLSKVSVIGVGLPTLDFSSLTSGYGVHLFSSVDYTNTRKNRHEFSGFIIKGGYQYNPITANGILIGHSTYTNNSLFTVKDISVEGFNINIEFTHNAWRVKLDSIYSRWAGSYNIFADKNLVNFGENINISNSMLCDGAEVTLKTGQWHFWNTSFDNITLIVGDSTAAATQVYVHGGHFENPGNSASYRYAIVNKGFLILDGTQLTVNSYSGSNFTKALFECNDTDQGIVLSNMQIFQQPYYKPYTDDIINALVVGNGKVQAKNLLTWINSNGYVIAKELNVLVNGDATGGNTSGWTVTGTGTVTIDATTVKSAPNSFKLEGINGNDVFFSQSFPVLPGQYVCANYWRKTDITDGYFGQQIDFYDYAGNKLTPETVGYQTINTTQDWASAGNNLVKRVPKGAVKATLLFQVQGTATTNKAWVDDVVINVI